MTPVIAKAHPQSMKHSTGTQSAFTSLLRYYTQQHPSALQRQHSHAKDEQRRARVCYCYCPPSSPLGRVHAHKQWRARINPRYKGPGSQTQQTLSSKSCCDCRNTLAQRCVQKYEYKSIMKRKAYLLNTHPNISNFSLLQLHTHARAHAHDRS